MLAVLTACGSDPTLEVVVTHATGTTVKYTTVTVYQSASMTCEDVEFARLDAVQLEALAVAEETIDATGAITGGLTGMSRTDNKVIVARDFDADDALVAINCAQKGEVVGADVVEIQTIIAAQASLKAPTDPADLAVAVSLTDSKGSPISDARPVSWTVYGPLGSSAASPSNVTTLSVDGDWQPTKPTCATNGIARLHPNPPSVVGGYAVQVRPAWAVELPPLYTGLTAATFAIDPKPKAGNALRHFCAIERHGTTRHVVCIDETPSVTPKSFQYTVTTSGGTATLSADVGTDVPGWPATQKAVAVVAVAPNMTSDDRDVYVVTDRGVLVPVYGAPPPIDTTPQCAAGCIDDAIAVPACGSTKGKVLMHANANMIRELDFHGGNPQNFPVPPPLNLTVVAELDNAGCVDQVSPAGTTPGQFATVHVGSILAGELAIGDTYLLACSNVTCALAMTADSKPVKLTRGASVGFSSENRMIATTVDATGVVLVRVKFAVNSGIIEDPPRMSAASLPEHVVTGKFDGDTNLGAVWAVSARVGTSFEVAYHRQIGNTGLPVEALSGLQKVTVASIASDDLDGDGNDDLLISAVEGIVVVPMNAAITGAANSDPTCSP